MEKFVFFFFVLVISSCLDAALGDCKTNFYCTSDVIGVSEYCTKECELNPGCYDDIVEDECEDGELMQMYDNPKDFCNCCPPKCIKYKKEGDDCEPLVSDRVPTEMCGPRLGEK